MNKHSAFITILFVLISLSLDAQKIEPGFYKCENSYVYIEADTIIMKCMDSFWYKGPFQLLDNNIILGNNVFLGKNAHIIKEECSSDSIEINFICKYQHILLDAPMLDSTIYEGESNFYSIRFNNWIFESNNNGVRIFKGMLSQEDLSGGFLLVESGLLSGFQDYFDIPLEFGTRYIIKQKYYKHFHPFIIHGQYKMSFEMRYDKNNCDIIIIDINNYSTLYHYEKPNCDSCIIELKNNFPLLFE